MAVRKSEAVWEGSLKDGSGKMKFGSGAYEGAYTWASRFENGKGTNPEELLAAAHEYIEPCYTDNILTQPLTVTGLCAHIGTYRSALMDYEHGDCSRLMADQGDDAGFRNAIKRIKAVCEHFAEVQLYSARNPAGPIFALKQFNWRDTVTVESSHTEIHTIDAGTRELLQGYMAQLAHAQRMTVIDVTPAPVRELVPVDNRQLSTETSGK